VTVVLPTPPLPRDDHEALRAERQPGRHVAHTTHGVVAVICVVVRVDSVASLL
jgi:hypothetical protein